MSVLLVTIAPREQQNKQLRVVHLELRDLKHVVKNYQTVINVRTVLLLAHLLP